jgi:lipopolysaccharide export system permease protein
MSSTDLGRSIASKTREFVLRRAGIVSESEEARAKLEDEYRLAVAGPGSWEGAAAILRPSTASVKSKRANKPIDRNLDLYRLEYYKKFSIPAGAAFFVVLSFPIGARARRAGRSVGFGLGLLIAVVYWALLLGGQTLGTRLGFSPFWAMWLPDIFVFIAGLGAWIGLGVRR